MTKFQPWIPPARVEELVQPEPALALLAGCVLAWLAYKIFLRNVSEERHRNLRAGFRNLAGHGLFAGVFFLVYFGLLRLQELRPESPLGSAIAYTGVFAIIWGTVVLAKLFRLTVFEYLFLIHRRAAVPLLLVNLVTLLGSLVLAGWVATAIFDIRLAPLLATSAIFSIVLGLAMQDTLGNLFAGIALQIDKPFELGDWVEVHHEGEKWAGQVTEISWRSALLQPPTDETVTVPNRVMAQAKISNFAARGRPIIRSQVFKLAHGTPIDEAKRILRASIEGVAGVRKDPAPVVFVSEAAESWMLFKLIYFIEDYGAQWRIADQVISSGVSALEREGHSIAPQRIEVVRPAIS